MATEFGTSLSNVHKTIKALEVDGVVVRFRRSGTFVADPAAAEARPPAPRRTGGTGAVVRAKVIHLVKPDIAGDVAQRYADALTMPILQLEEALNIAGYRVDHVPVSLAPSPTEIGQVVRKLAGENAHGLALLATLGVTPDQRCEPREDPSLLLPYVDALRPFPGQICWFNWSGMSLTRWPFDAVSFMPFQEGCVAGRYLAENGVRRAIWIGVEIAGWSRMRYDGLCAAMGGAAAGPIPVEAHWYLPHKRHARKPMIDLLHHILADVAKRGDRPTIVPCGDMLAATLIEIAAEYGMQCPRDFCVVSFDNVDPTCGLNLTTVAPPVTKIGPVMAQVLTGQIARPAGGPLAINLPSCMVERATFTVL